MFVDFGMFVYLIFIIFASAQCTFLWSTKGLMEIGLMSVDFGMFVYLISIIFDHNSLIMFMSNDYFFNLGSIIV